MSNPFTLLLIILVGISMLTKAYLLITKYKAVGLVAVVLAVVLGTIIYIAASA